ncbi:YmL10 [Thecaphora frezii]
MSAATLARSLARLSLATSTSASASTSSSAFAASRSVSSYLRSFSSLSSSSSRISRVSALPPTASLGQRGYASETGGSMALGSLKPGQPKKTRKRLGRGPSSGRGGTSTRGHKGQKARAGNGKPVPGFEGGQTPLTRRFPKRGFNNVHAQKYVPVNLDKIQHWIDRGLLDPSAPITAKELYETRCIHSLRDGVKILGDGAGHLVTPINVVVNRASRSAIEVIEALGGSVECRYYNKLSLTALVKPHKFAGRLMPRPADPTSKKDLLYYSSPSKRGYLAKRHAIKQQQSVS